MRGSARAYAEQALPLHCLGRQILAIACLPEQPADTAVVIVVGGPQYRVGSHRQFVLLARHLADSGIASLRFDLRGMGDSEGEHPGFEDAMADIGVAIDALLVQAGPAVSRIVLWGLCDAASAALLYWQHTRDTRIGGLCLLNPWVRSTTGLARAQVKHYYTKRLREREFWAKLLSGKVAARALSGLIGNLTLALRAPAGAPDSSRPTFQQTMARAWQEFPGAMLLILSGRDLTAKEFLDHSRTDPHWQGTMARQGLLVHELPDADHTFSASAHSAEVASVTLGWIRGMKATASQHQTHEDCT